MEEWGITCWCKLWRRVQTHLCRGARTTWTDELLPTAISQRSQQVSDPNRSAYANRHSTLLIKIADVWEDEMDEFAYITDIQCTHCLLSAPSNKPVVTPRRHQRWRLSVALLSLEVDPQ